MSLILESGLDQSARFFKKGIDSSGNIWDYKSCAKRAPEISFTKLDLRVWLSGRASPCQGECRAFESRHPLKELLN